MRNVLLLADNNAAFRETWGKVLTEAGYYVLFAENPEQARSILRNSLVDLAILDQRLDNDDDNDISGLEIATDPAFQTIPKIVLTGFPPKPENVHKVLSLKVDELPPAIAFMGKDQGPEALLAVIRDTPKIWFHLRISTKNVTRQVESDHQEARRQATLNYIAASTVAIVGFLAIFTGIFLAWFDKLAIGIIGATSGLVLEAIGYLFFTRLDRANERMDIYHRELLQTYWLELLLAVSEQLPAPRQAVCTEKVIRVAANSWFSSSPNAQLLSRTGHQNSQEP